MRQAGILAAGALHALAHHRVRLREDHAHARALAEGLANRRGVTVDVGLVETNIVNIDLQAPASAVASAARAKGVLVQATGPHRLRAVTHLDVTRRDIDAAIEVIAEAAIAAHG
jgi:threonine aldolase